jgi:hypothetical protein
MWCLAAKRSKSIADNHFSLRHQLTAQDTEIAKPKAALRDRDDTAQVREVSSIPVRERDPPPQAYKS